MLERLFNGFVLDNSEHEYEAKKLLSAPRTVQFGVTQVLANSVSYHNYYNHSAP
jgi:hypothetical protein